MFGRTRQLKDPGGKRPGGGWVSKHGSQSPAKQKEEATWKQDTLEGLEKGSRVWYKADFNSWVLGTLQTQQAGAWTVALHSEYGEATGEVITCKSELLVPANPTILDGVPDLTNLTYLNEPSILHGLNLRYAEDLIYTHAGPVLIAINPFKQVPLYTADIVERYVNRGTPRDGTEPPEPHVFLTADTAYKAMCRSGANQSLVITGESGSGKTETTKIAMQYLAGLAGGTGVEDAVLATNPLLEAFGNAKTLRNNNSSRFGKLIEIYFDRGHHICGALIQTYLLEKSRVVHQLPGERNYHVFYQLCKAMKGEQAEQLRIPADALKRFRYLNQSGCTAIAGTDDVADFHLVQHAMDAVNIDVKSQSQVWVLLAAILWLGNIEFDPAGEDSVTVRRDEALTNAAELLSVPEHELATALSERSLSAGGETIQRRLRLDAAEDARDALAKAVYAALFRWLVTRVNAFLAVGKKVSGTTLSILDIYGFECFVENSFEQLCINYANERLQQQFNRHLFKVEQEAYESEGIDWAHVDFEDNQDCVDLLEARPPRGVGILSLLDEECLFPKSTDSTFGEKLRHELRSHPSFAFDPRIPSLDFAVRHYAGEVLYSCDKFLDKNRDTLSPDLVILLERGNNQLVVQLAEDMAHDQINRAANTTVGARFREQLRDLIARLDKTELHFVRCIKPNNDQAQDDYDAPLVLHQLRCCGITEVARIARAGYPTRYAHQQFAHRYSALLGNKLPRKGEPVLDICKELLDKFGVKSEQYQIGRTKLFFRAGVLGQLEDAATRINKAVLLIQSYRRMLPVRRAFLRARAASVKIQAAERGRVARREYKELKRRNAAAIRLQAWTRGHQQRVRYLRVLRVTLVLQIAVRRYQLAKRVAAREAERKAREAALVKVAEAEAAQRAAKEAAAEEVRRKERASFATIKDDFGIEQDDVYEVVGAWHDHAADVEEYVSIQEEYSLDAKGIREAAKQYVENKDELAQYRALRQDTGMDAEGMRKVVSSWQTHGAKLEAVRAEFQTDPQSIRDILRLWQRHGHQINSFLESGGAEALQNGGGTKGLPQVKEHPENGNSEEVAELQTPQKTNWRSNTIAEEPEEEEAGTSGSRPQVLSASACQQLALWEEYADEVEEQMRVLLADNALLQAALAEVRSQLTHERPSSAGAAGRREEPWALPAARPETGEAAPSANGAVAVQTYVRPLAEELERKRALFMDDASFITEVREGRALAPGMDPEAELRTLRLRFDNFRRDFKARLDITAENMKRIEKEEKKAARRGSLRVSGSGDSRTASEASMDVSGGQHQSFGGDADAHNKAGLSNMLSRLSFRRPH